MLTSRCKHFGVNETVPRHACSLSECEFEDLEKCRREEGWWIDFEDEHKYFPGTFSNEYSRKREFAEKLAKALDKSKSK